MTVATSFLLNTMAQKLMAEISAVKLIVNNEAKSGTISKKEIVRNNVVRISIAFVINPDDIFNGVDFYDANGNLLISDRINLNFNVQGATYVYECDLISEKVM